jgi:hypothetical protein
MDHARVLCVVARALLPGAESLPSLSVSLSHTLKVLGSKSLCPRVPLSLYSHPPRSVRLDCSAHMREQAEVVVQGALELAPARLLGSMEAREWLFQLG